MKIFFSFYIILNNVFNKSTFNLLEKLLEPWEDAPSNFKRWLINVFNAFGKHWKLKFPTLSNNLSLLSEIFLENIQENMKAC